MGRDNVLSLSVPHVIKPFAKFYHIRSVLIVKCYNRFEQFYTAFYGDLIDMFKRIVEKTLSIIMSLSTVQQSQLIVIIVCIF